MTADGGDDVLSFLYLTSEDTGMPDFPDLADVLDHGNLVTGTGRFFDVTGGPLDFGETIYATIVAFDNVDPSDPDAHQMKDFHVRGAFTNLTGTKTYRFTARQIVPSSLLGVTYFFAYDTIDGYDAIVSGLTGLSGFFHQFGEIPFLLPDQCRVQDYTAYLYRNAGDGEAEVDSQLWKDGASQASVTAINNGAMTPYAAGLDVSTGTARWTIFLDIAFDEDFATQLDAAAAEFFVTFITDRLDGTL